ncbi:MAG TPA: HD domain-containing protein [Spirochaetia bacterium]|nr:HD domain-containing protein [Spirochaetia bacterium]
MAGKAQLLSHLYSDYTEPIRDPLWRHIYLSREFESILATPPFQKLTRIRQLGPAFQVYPGATHTRFNHSLGVFHLSKRILAAILQFESAIDLSLEEVKAFLSAALLHDLGHFPYSHSLKELPLKDHEVLTGDLVVEEPLRGIIRDVVGSDPELVAAIVDTKRSFRNGASNLHFFRNILSGVLDPDKLDYLNRDAYFCGVPYGIQDIDFVVNKIRPHSTSGIAIDESGITAIEHVLFSKYLMYRTVYWHKTVRVATAMIKKAVYLTLKEGLLRPEDLYHLDDIEFYGLFDGLAFPPASLIRRVFDRRYHKIVFEAPFDDTNERHTWLLDLENRMQKEGEVAAELRRRSGSYFAGEAVIIDIPEFQSFEIGLPISSRDGFRPFAETDSVFGKQVVSGFNRALRKIRLLVAEELASKVNGIEELLE